MSSSSEEAALVTLTREMMEGMSADVVLGIAETIWHNADFESPAMKAHFQQRYPLEVVRAWTKEQAISFALPYKCQIKKPKPPKDAPKPKVSVTTTNMPAHLELKGGQGGDGGSGSG